MENDYKLYIAIAEGMFFNEEHTIKIGITKDIKKRASAIQNGCPAKLGFVFVGITSKSDAANIESNLKKALNDFRTGGGTEWFSMRSDNLDRLLQNCKDLFSNGDRKIHPLFSTDSGAVSGREKDELIDVPVLGPSGGIESTIKAKASFFAPFSAPLG